MIVIVMGVSGSGKSYLANKLAEKTGWIFAEGDDYHSDANKAKMHAGTPLTDKDRAPWLATLHQLLASWQQQGTPGILTCSALKSTYREQLADGLPDARFVWLDPSRSVLMDRMAHRSGHFMPAALLDSQLATLQPPVSDPNTLRLDGTEPIEQEIDRILAWLQTTGVKPRTTESADTSDSSIPVDLHQR
ncbi:gluconokinase [Acidicapsa ligni]|uniref:gluconokinase n=1 Tax=Acidicapsa ligni TaxID=542300 RepID=UPI0021DF4F6B|nr:gluconokinase [Acidicapsa ligni]